MSPALEPIERRAAKFQGLLESQQSSVGSSSAMRSVARGSPGAVEGFQRQLGEGADRFGQRPESISGQPPRGARVLGELTAELLEAYPRTTAGLTAAAGAVLSGYLAYKGGRGAIDVLRGGRLGRRGTAAVGDLIERGAGRVSGGSEIQRVFVTNWPVPGGDSTLESARRPAQRKRGQTPRRKRARAVG